MATNLTFAEEVMLLMLHDEDGSFVRLPDWTVRYSLSGAVLMELAHLDRVDTDLSKLYVVNSAPTDDSLLNTVLLEIESANRQEDIRFWVERIAVHSDAIKERALESLTERGIIKKRDEAFLWVFKSRRYPVVDGKADKEVKLRLFDLLFSDALPDPRDVVLLCLTHASGLLSEILPQKEIENVNNRIEQVRKLDLIGQEVAKAIWDIEVSIAVSSQPQFI